MVKEIKPKKRSNIYTKSNGQITYNGEIVAGSLLITESRQIARLLLDQADQDQWHRAIMIENILQKRSPVTAKRKTRLIRNTYLTKKIYVFPSIISFNLNMNQENGRGN